MSIEHGRQNRAVALLLQPGTDVTIVRRYLAHSRHRDHEPLHSDEPEDESRCSGKEVMSLRQVVASWCGLHRLHREADHEH